MLAAHARSDGSAGWSRCSARASLPRLWRQAGGQWETGSRRWLIEPRRIGPLIRALRRGTDPLLNCVAGSGEIAGILLAVTKSSGNCRCTLISGSAQSPMLPITRNIARALSRHSACRTTIRAARPRHHTIRAVLPAQPNKTARKPIRQPRPEPPSRSPAATVQSPR